jgi:chromosome segregation ATPase
MSDEAVVDDPGTEPVSPAGNEDESTLVEVPAATEEESPAEDDEDKGKDADPAQGRSPAFQKLLDKYGGDYDKLASAYFEQANSSSKLHSEIQEIKEMVAAGRKLTAEEEGQAVADDPYVKEVNTDLSAVSEEAQGVVQAQKGLVGQYQKLELKIAQLEGEYKRADETDRSEVSRELNEAKRDMNELKRDYKDSQRDLARLNTQWKTLQRSLREAEGQARSRVDRERQDALRLQTDAAESRVEYNAALRDEVVKYGIDPSSKTYNVLNETIKSRLFLHMQALKAQGVREGIDLPKAVSAMMEEYAETMGLKKSTLKTTSKEKLDTLSSKQITAPAKGSGAPSKDKAMSAEQWKTRARQLMP